MIIEMYNNSAMRQSFVNFWIRASNNPDIHITKNIYKFISQCGNQILPNGCFVAYRSLVPVEDNSEVSCIDLDKFVSTIRNRKKGLSKYVYDPSINDILPITKQRLKEGLSTIQELLIKQDKSDVCTKFTDGYTKKMDIRLGSIVSIPRSLCDNDPNATCSKGLHLGNKNFGIPLFGSTQVVAICDPFCVVSIPYTNSNKLRCCAYLPVDVVENHTSHSLDLEGLSEMYQDEISSILSNDFEQREVTSSDMNFIQNYIYSSNVNDLLNVDKIDLDLSEITQTISNRFISTL